MVCSSESAADLHVAQTLIERGVPIDSPTTSFGGTPLMHAAYSEKVDHMQLPIEHGASVGAVGKLGYNVLQMVVSHCPVVTLKYLFACHKDALPLGNAVSKTFLTNLGTSISLQTNRLIHLSCDYVDIMKCLLETIPSQFWTPLHFAVMNRHNDVVRLLLEEGAVVNALTEDGETAVALAAIVRNGEMIHLLCAKGATLQFSGMQNTCKYHSARHPTSLALMAAKHIPLDFSSNSIGFVARQFNHDSLSFILASTGTLTDYIQSSACSLGALIAEQSTKFFRHVLRYLKGTDLLTAQLNEMRLSPLCYAVQRGLPRMVELLLEAGTEIDLHGCDEGTAVTLACAANGFEVVKPLVRRGASWSYRDEHGRNTSCLQRAARYQHIQRWLLIERWTDQTRIYDHAFNRGQNGAEQEVKFWSRYREVSAPLADQFRQMCIKTLLSWHIRKRKKLKWFEGKVLHYGEGIEFPSANYS